MPIRAKGLIFIAIALVFVGGVALWAFKANRGASEEVSRLQSLLLPPAKNPVVLVNVEEGEMDFVDATNVTITEQLTFTPEICKQRELDWLDRSGRTGNEVGVYRAGYWRGSNNVQFIIGAGMPSDNIEKFRQTMSAPCSRMVTSRKDGGLVQDQRVMSELQPNEEWMGAYPAAIIYQSWRTGWYRQGDPPGEDESSEFGAQVRVGNYDVSVHATCECVGPKPPDARADLLSALHRQVKVVEAATK